MGRNLSVFASPSEVIDVVEECCHVHGWLLWEFPEGSMQGPVRTVPSLTSTSRGLVWIGPPAEREEWSSREASLDTGFACVVRPSVVDGSSSVELTMTEFFDAGRRSSGTVAVLDVIRRSFRGRIVGGVVAVSADRSSLQSTGIKITRDAVELWRSGVVLRQVVGAPVFFEPAA